MSSQEQEDDMVLITAELLRDLTHKAGLVDNLLDLFKINACDLLIGLVQQDLPTQQALNGERKKRSLNQHQNRYICFPN